MRAKESVSGAFENFGGPCALPTLELPPTAHIYYKEKKIEKRIILDLKHIYMIIKKFKKTA